MFAHRVHALSALFRHPGAGRASIAAFRDAQLRRLIRHSYQHVPYYRQLFSAHAVNPNEILSVRDLEHIPISCKQMLRAQARSELLARGVRPERLIVRRTSGSSGEPFAVYRTWLEKRLLEAFRIRAGHAMGLRAGDRRAGIELRYDVQKADWQVLLKLLNALGLYQRRAFNCLDHPRDYVQELAAFDPHVVTGFPVAISKLADYLEQHAPGSVRPRVVMVGGETLTPRDHQQIERGFGAPLFDTYGAVEFNMLAWKCPHADVYHVNDDALALEVLKEDGSPARPGESGEVVATNLHTFAMPIIRYRLGDIVVRGEDECVCGSPFSTIRSIQGRVTEYFRLPDGREVHPYEFSVHRLVTATWIREYRLVQERPDKFVCYIVPRDEWHEDDVRKIRHTAAAVFGSDVSFVVSRVSDLPLEFNGKFRPFVPFRQA